MFRCDGRDPIAGERAHLGPNGSVRSAAKVDVRGPGVSHSANAALPVTNFREVKDAIGHVD